MILYFFAVCLFPLSFVTLVQIYGIILDIASVWREMWKSLFVPVHLIILLSLAPVRGFGILMAVSSLDEDEKLLYQIRISGQNRTVNIINESGLYALVFQSKKPTAKQFRKWVTKEVIPAIRKTGGYGINRLETPNFVRRFNDNWDRTDRGYFSVISELFIRLYGRFEQLGYSIPNSEF